MCFCLGRFFMGRFFGISSNNGVFFMILGNIFIHFIPKLGGPNWSNLVRALTTCCPVEATIWSRTCKCQPTKPANVRLKKNGRPERGILGFFTWCAPSSFKRKYSPRSLILLEQERWNMMNHNNSAVDHSVTKSIRQTGGKIRESIWESPANNCWDRSGPFFPPQVV